MEWRSGKRDEGEMMQAPYLQKERQCRTQTVAAAIQGLQSAVHTFSLINLPGAWLGLRKKAPENLENWWDVLLNPRN